MGVLKVRLPGGPWLPITGVGTNPGISQDQADARYVNITGDTMTGLLTGTGGVTLGSPGKWSGYSGLGWGPTGDYLIMADANDTYVSTARPAGSVFLRAGQNSTYELGIHASGNNTLNGNLNLGSNVLAAERGDFGWSGIRLGGSKVLGWFQNGDDTWVRSLGDKGIYTGGQMQAGNMQCNGDMNISGTTTGNHTNTRDGYRFTSNGGSGGSWGNGSFIAQKWSGGDTAKFTMHPGGVAKNMGLVTNNGTIFFWNEESTGYADLWCNTVSQASSIRGKTDIAAWPPKSAGSAVMGAANRLSLIDVVSYCMKPELHLIQAETVVEGQESRLHDCDIDDCDGTSAEPCLRVRDQQSLQLGVIIEDLVTVLPEAVAIGPDGEPGAMRLGSMIGYLLAVCKEQQERIEALEQSHQEAA